MEFVTLVLYDSLQDRNHSDPKVRRKARMVIVGIFGAVAMLWTLSLVFGK